MSKCQKQHCVPTATARERHLALHVAALAKNPSWVFRSARVINAVELVAAAATFVVGRVKSNLALARVADVPNEAEKIPSGPGHSNSRALLVVEKQSPAMAVTSWQRGATI